MTTVAKVLETYAPEISETDFAADLRSKFEAVHGADDTSLTAAELEFLAQNGGETARTVLDEWDPEAERRRRNRIVEESALHIYVHTLSVLQVAAVTGKSRSQITRDVNNGKLYARSVGRQWRIPRWQLAAERVIPGLAQVVPAIPDHLHPTVVEGFMTTPQDDLDATTPVDYLRTGGDPARVAQLVVELAR